MTSEELNRTIEFIIQSQARLAVVQEQYQEWTKGLLGQMATNHQRIIELIDLQSRRMDRNEEALRKTEEAQRKQELFQREFLQDFRNEAQESRLRHEEALARLDRILERLTDRKN